MHSSLECIPCLLRQTIEAGRRITSDTNTHERLVRDVLRMAAEMPLDQSPPIGAQLTQRRLRELCGVADPYRELKSCFNSLAMVALPELAAAIALADDPLLEAAKCAVAANAIDVGAVANLSESEVRAALRGAPESLVHPNWTHFIQAAAKAKSILYLADNAGEIAVDRLVIQRLGPERVTLVVRGAPVLNDATMADAREVRMQDLVEVIDNGSDAPATVLEDCSEAFRQRFEQADLIIAKGQGNYESLSDLRRPIAFWFKVKCELVANLVGLPMGVHALLPPGLEESIQ